MGKGGLRPCAFFRYTLILTGLCHFVKRGQGFWRCLKRKSFRVFGNPKALIWIVAQDLATKRDSMADNDKMLTLHGVYNTLYSALTRPDFKFAVTRYFIDEWAPLLGPSLAWLIVGLRQHCYWNQRRDWCIIDKASLSRDTALNERTIERCLKKPFSGWFVTEVKHRYRYRTQIGKKVRDKNRYQLLLDDPLSPRHQLGLANLLKQTAQMHGAPAVAEAAPPRDAPPGDPLELGLAVVQALLDTPHLTDKISYSGKLPRTIQRRTILELVEEALDFKLSRYADDPRLAELDRRATQLYNQIVQPNKVYIGWQYFRLQWLPLLGHALAWFVIYLRRSCFWDEASGELRDTYTGYKKELAAAIGQTPRNLANLMENPYAPLFFSIIDPPEAEAAEAKKRKRPRNAPTVYRVRLVDEPLTPDDQQRVATELQQRLQGELYGLDPESGQLNLFPIFDRSSGRQNFAYGQAAEKMSPSDPKIRRLDQQPPEKMPQLSPALSGKIAATLDDSPILSDVEQRLEKQERSAAELKGLKILLDDLSVQEPALSKLLADPNLTIARIGAWILYAETQPGLREPHSYVIKRLLAGDPPPAEFVAFARLDDAVWLLFEETAFRLRAGQPLSRQMSSNLVETFIDWAKIYAGLEPAETRYLLEHYVAAPDGGSQRGGPLGGEETQGRERETAQALWNAALDQLRLQMAKQTFNNWLQPTELYDYQENLFVIDAKTPYAKAWLENRLLKTVERALSGVVGAPTQVQFVVVER